MIRKPFQEKQELAKLFGEVAYEQVHILAANEKAAAQKKYDDAKKKGASPAELKSLQANVDAWGESGINKIALHATVGGLMSEMGGSGFASGAVGAGVNEAAQKVLSNIKDPGLHQIATALLGAAAAKVAGGDAQAGASTAASGTKNNIYKDGDIRIQTELITEGRTEVKLTDGKVVIEVDDEALADYALPIAEAFEKLSTFLDATDFALSQLPPTPPGVVALVSIKGGKVVVKIAKAATKADDVIDATRGVSKAGFRTPELLNAHFEKHAAEFGNITKEQYLKAAQEFASSAPSESILTKTRANGDTIFYNKITNEFAVKAEDGVIRTYFKPTGGLSYFEGQ